MTGVLDATELESNVVHDVQAARSRCDFWVQVAAAMTNLGGASDE